MSTPLKTRRRSTVWPHVDVLTSVVIVFCFSMLLYVYIYREYHKECVALAMAAIASGSSHEQVATSHDAFRPIESFSINNAQEEAIAPQGETSAQVSPSEHTEDAKRVSFAFGNPTPGT